MANTQYGVNHPLAVKVWSRKLFRAALAETYMNRFMGKSKGSLIYVKDELSKGPGDTVHCGLRMQMSGDGVTGDSTLEGNEEALVTHRDTLVINQLRHAARSDGRASEQRVPFSVREECLDGLRDWWADRLDTVFFNHLCGETTASAGTHDGGNTPTAATSAAGNTRILYGAGSTSTTASFTATSSNSGSIRQVNFQLPVIDKFVNQAKIASPIIRPIRVDGKDKYVGFLHPNQVRQLRQNAAAGTVNWFDIQRARVEGGERENPIYNGALGEYNGVILHESNRLPALSTDSNVKRAVFCGAQAALFATGRDNSDTEMRWVEELFDYENQLGVAAGMIFGLKKTVYNSIDFATCVVLSHSPNPS
jgi:N4-gp56 family major capsid protein